MQNDPPNQPTAEDEASALVGRLAGSDKSAWAPARDALLQLGPAAMPAVVHGLAMEKRKRDRVVLGARLLGVAMLCFGLADFLHLIPWPKPSPDAVEAFLYALMAVMAGLLALVKPVSEMVTASEKRLIPVLSKLADASAIGMMLEVAASEYYTTYEPVSTALVNLLPHLRYSDGDKLTDRQKANLYYRVRWGRHELRLAAIQAVEQVGDAAAIPAVRHAATEGAVTPKQMALREAARRCLETLEQRADAARKAGTLLRAAQSPGEARAVLLRPAASADADEDVLLRATDRDD